MTGRHHVLFYEKVSDFAERQTPFADAHRAHVLEAAVAGILVLAGSLGDPDDGGALPLFESPSPEAAETFAGNDPYVIGGVIRTWTVRTLDLVIGSERVERA